MALGDSSIKYLSDCMSASDENVRKFYSDLETAIDKLNKNATYTTFVANTNIGKSIDEKIKRLRVIGKSTGSDVEKLIKNTRIFLDQQKELNRRGSQSSNQGTGAPGGTPSGINYAADPRFYYTGGGH